MYFVALIQLYTNNQICRRTSYTRNLNALSVMPFETHCYVKQRQQKIAAVVMNYSCVLLSVWSSSHMKNAKGNIFTGIQEKRLILTFMYLGYKLCPSLSLSLFLSLFFSVTHTSRDLPICACVKKNQFRFQCFDRFHVCVLRMKTTPTFETGRKKTE